jgi:multidrug efflux pump
MILALTSSTLPLPKIEDLADALFATKLSQLPGVGLVSVTGGSACGAHQANPTALAAYGLSLDDVRTAISNANTNQAREASTVRRARRPSTPTTSSNRPTSTRA